MEIKIFDIENLLKYSRYIRELKKAIVLEDIALPTKYYTLGTRSRVHLTYSLIDDPVKRRSTRNEKSKLVKPETSGEYVSSARMETLQELTAGYSLRNIWNLEELGCSPENSHS